MLQYTQRNLVVYTGKGNKAVLTKQSTYYAYMQEYQNDLNRSRICISKKLYRRRIHQTVLISKHQETHQDVFDTKIPMKGQLKKGVCRHLTLSNFVRFMVTYTSLQLLVQVQTLYGFTGINFKQKTVESNRNSKGMNYKQWPL